MPKRVFITGGTGRSSSFLSIPPPPTPHSASCSGTNGPFVCQALVAAGHHVVALVRNPDKPEAAELRSLGVELLLGDTKCALLSRAALCFAVVCARPVRADAESVCSDLSRQDTPQMEKVGSCDWVVWLSVNWVR
jgi:NAD(P)-dependent dehydrogenase (short-subunit alcohol dehydrogenase family)